MRLLVEMNTWVFFRTIDIPFKVLQERKQIGGIFQEILLAMKSWKDKTWWNVAAVADRAQAIVTRVPLSVWPLHSGYGSLIRISDVLASSC